MYKKVFLLSIYILVHKLDIYLLETYLNSETSSADDNLAMLSYNIIRDNPPSNTTRGGVAFIIKTHCSTFSINWYKIYSGKHFVWNKNGKKCCKCVCLYRSPSQTNDELESFLKNLNRFLIKFINKIYDLYSRWF